MASAAPTAPTLDDLFADPDGIIAALVAAMPAPSADAAVRVSSLLAVR